MQSNWQKILLSPHLSEDKYDSSLLDKIAFMIVKSEWITAEASLLSNLPNIKEQRDYLSLLAYLDLRVRNFSRLNRLIPKLIGDYGEDEFVKSLLIFWSLLTGNSDLVNSLPSSFWNKENESRHLCLAHSHWLIANNAYEECRVLIDKFLRDKSLERDLLLAKLSSANGDYRKAIDLLIPWTSSAVGNQRYWRVFLNSHFQLQEGKKLAFYIKQGIEEIPQKEELLDLFAWGSLLNKKPALARHSLLKQRLMGWNLLDPISIAHLYNSHELLGETSNLIHVHPKILADPKVYLDVHSNLLVHLTSIEDSSIKSISQELMNSVKSTPGFSKHEPLNNQKNLFEKKKRKRLKIAWITGDCRYHPVSRFLLGLLYDYSDKFIHDHSLISTRSLEDEIPKCFNDIKGLECLDFSQFKAHHLTHAIRDVKADIAIDLSGWTSGHSAVAFISRVA